MTLATSEVPATKGNGNGEGAGNGRGVDQIPAFPTRRDEAWRYAPHRELSRLVFGATVESQPVVPAEVEAQIPDIDGPTVVLVNGVVDRARSSLAPAGSGSDTGLTVSTVAEAADDPAGLVAAHLGDGSGVVVDAFVALGRRHSRDGAYVHVGGGHEADRPVHIVNVTVPILSSEPDAASDAEVNANAVASGVVIRLDDNSTATVVETHVGTGGAFGGAASRTTVEVGSGSTLTHIILQDVPSERIQLSRVDVNQRAASRYEGRSFNLGASYGRVDYQVNLTEPEATADLAGLYFGFGHQTLDQQVNIAHQAGNCVSRQSFRGVLDDESTGVFSGGIAVSPGADGTDAEQANHNLILSTRAEVNTQPRLEILADDVVCAHGATVGQLDEDALYYMRSRGIGADEARKLLIAGFADQTVDDIEIDSVRAWIIERLGHGHA